MDRIAVIGAGSWGTALAIILSNKGQEVSLWGRDEELVSEMGRTRRNPRYISEVELPGRLEVTSDIGYAMEGAGILVMAVPSHAMREAARAISPLIKEERILVSLAKGLEDITFKRMTEVIADEIPQCEGCVAALSGPNHAEEVSIGIPTATVVSSKSASIDACLQDIFLTASFKVYRNSDLIGVELGGASKNVIAIAAGISDGLGYGDNTKASLMTRGLAEMTRLGTAMGARPSTFAGLSGIGDLLATCTSLHSRNRAVGERLGQGQTLDRIVKEMRMVAEGVKAARAVNGLSRKIGIEMPITTMVYQVLYEGRDIKSCVEELMMRDPADEMPT